MTGPLTSPLSLRISRTISAPRPRVFRAWTEPAGVAQWLAPDPLIVSLAEADPRVGGQFRVHMQAPGGSPEYRMVGVYSVVLPPSLLVFSWKIESDPDPVDTRVTVQFVEREGGNSTEVTILHELFPTEEMCARHQQGWTGCLAKLPAAVRGLA